MRSLNGVQKQVDELARWLSPARLRVERWPDRVILRWGPHRVIKVLLPRFWDSL